MIGVGILLLSSFIFSNHDILVYFHRSSWYDQYSTIHCGLRFVFNLLLLVSLLCVMEDVESLYKVAPT